MNAFQGPVIIYPVALQFTMCQYCAGFGLGLPCVYLWLLLSTMKTNTEMSTEIWAFFFFFVCSLVLFSLIFCQCVCVSDSEALSPPQFHTLCPWLLFFFLNFFVIIFCPTALFYWDKFGYIQSLCEPCKSYVSSWGIFLQRASLLGGDLQT